MQKSVIIMDEKIEPEGVEKREGDGSDDSGKVTMALGDSMRRIIVGVRK